MNSPSNHSRWRPRFTLATLLKGVLVASILAAVLGGLLRETAAGNVSVVFFLAMLIAAPLAITIGLSLVEPLRKLLLRRKSRK